MIDRALDEITQPCISGRWFDQKVQPSRLYPHPRVVFSFIKLRCRKIPVDFNEEITLKSRQPSMAPLPFGNLLPDHSDDPTSLLKNFSGKRPFIGFPAVHVPAYDVPGARRDCCGSGSSHDKHTMLAVKNDGTYAQAR